MTVGNLIEAFVNVGLGTRVIVRNFKCKIIGEDAARNLLLDVVLFNEERRDEA